MTEAPQRVPHYGAFLNVIRERVAELGITHETVDAISGLQGGYFSKLVCDPPIKRMGPFTLFLVCDALGLQVALCDHPEALARIQSRLVRRLRPRRMHSGSVHSSKTIILSPDLLRMRAAKGGSNSRKYLGKRRIKQIAQQAARARWARVSARQQ